MACMHMSEGNGTPARGIMANNWKVLLAATIVFYGKNVFW